MHFLSWWQGMAVAGIFGMGAWGLRWELVDFFLDRFGDVLRDRLRRRDRQPDAGERTDRRHPTAAAVADHGTTRRDPAGNASREASPLERTRQVEGVRELQDHPAQSILIIRAQERRLHTVVLIDHEDSSE